MKKTCSWFWYIQCILAVGAVLARTTEWALADLAISVICPACGSWVEPTSWEEKEKLRCNLFPRNKSRTAADQNLKLINQTHCCEPEETAVQPQSETDGSVRLSRDRIGSCVQSGSCVPTPAAIVLSFCHTYTVPVKQVHIKHVFK